MHAAWSLMKEERPKLDENESGREKERKRENMKDIFNIQLMGELLCNG